MLKQKYDLQDRTFNFALDVRHFCKNLETSLINSSDIKQVVRSSGSIGANYIEANESLGPEDFKMRLKIARKEAMELNKILSSIINKTKD
ncbi:four helix bundle protein [Aquimarina gracilis]|uniref:Four helix bundle protein n=1 Tax=Aquimarina gracilis TaxID=874422 RepID=A0ABU5ZSM4_9FLAO|nr:four helix bundle protein [Aquimarina gracilis]MEB3345074.1 four helix bundle protein [Aquimarina gracilis]